MGWKKGGNRGEAVIMVHVQLPAASEGNSEFQMPSVASGTKDKLMMQAEAPPPPPLAYSPKPAHSLYTQQVTQETAGSDALAHISDIQ